MIGRIVRSVDFERVLSAPSRARSTHFVVHHLQGAPSLPGKPAEKLAAHKQSTELSTSVVDGIARTVDDAAVEVLGDPIPSDDGVWMGVVVPKRYARRSVTRTLLKRQIRAAVARRQGGEAGLPNGLWVVRLRSPFGVKDFPSAASDALRQAARGELDALLADAVRRVVRA